MLLEVNSIQVCYGRMVAVSDVSLSVPEGGFVAMLGANGAGKSTTLRAISGLVAISQGAIRFAGASVVGLPAHTITRRGIAHVPEGRGVLSGLTVQENLHAGALGNPDPKHIAGLRDKVFGYFPVLQSRLGQLAGLLSGGEQQMLAISRALMGKPKLLLLDEPSLGLSPLLVQQIFGIIRRINEEQGVAILLVEQNAHIALKTADYGYVLEVGRVVIEDQCAMLIHRDDIKEFYLGQKEAGVRGQRRWKRKREWN